MTSPLVELFMFAQTRSIDQLLRSKFTIVDYISDLQTKEGKLHPVEIAYAQWSATHGLSDEYSSLYRAAPQCPEGYEAELKVAAAEHKIPWSHNGRTADFRGIVQLLQERMKESPMPMLLARHGQVKNIEAVLQQAWARSNKHASNNDPSPFKGRILSLTTLSVHLAVVMTPRIYAPVVDAWLSSPHLEWTSVFCPFHDPNALGPGEGTRMCGLARAKLLAFNAIQLLWEAAGKAPSEMTKGVHCPRGWEPRKFWVMNGQTGCYPVSK
jgi:hypothetical protein